MKIETLKKILADAGIELVEDENLGRADWQAGYGVFLYLSINGHKVLCNRIQAWTVKASNSSTHREYTHVSFERDYYSFLQGDIEFIETVKVIG